jgi:spore maturation protein CgeB
MHVDNWVLGQDMVRAVSSYRVQWNRNLADDVNYRTFETLACRTALVTNVTLGLDRLFDLDHDLFAYTDDVSMHEAIQKALHDADEAERRAHNGYERVLSRHAYTHRMKELFGAVR